MWVLWRLLVGWLVWFWFVFFKQAGTNFREPFPFPCQMPWWPSKLLHTKQTIKPYQAHSICFTFIPLWQGQLNYYHLLKGILYKSNSKCCRQQDWEERELIWASCYSWGKGSWLCRWLDVFSSTYNLSEVCNASTAKLHLETTQISNLYVDFHDWYSKLCKDLIIMKDKTFQNASLTTTASPRHFSNRLAW